MISAIRTVQLTTMERNHGTETRVCLNVTMQCAVLPLDWWCKCRCRASK